MYSINNSSIKWEAVNYSDAIFGGLQNSRALKKTLRFASGGIINLDMGDILSLDHPENCAINEKRIGFLRPGPFL